MQLNEILEENSIESISEKTNIAEDKIEYLIDKNFEAINKQKTLGFISIIEREYNIDLDELRNEAKAYHKEFDTKEGIVPIRPSIKENRGSSKLFVFIILLLLGYSSWFFISKFNKKDLSNLVPFFNTSTNVDNLDGNDSFNNVIEK